MSLILDRTADTDAPILDVLAERWSTRIFDPSVTIDEAALASALEAARWAPSASNTQPWRLIVARRGTAEHASIVASLIGFNQAWAADAAALVVFAAVSALDGKPLHFATYDVGQAAAHFTVQAHASGLHTHQMGGFDPADIAEAFSFADDLSAVTVMAVGAIGDIENAADALRERDLAPRSRRPIAETLLINA